MRALLKEHTILYVEDEPDIRREMCEYLQGYFRDVYSAADGREGLEMYRRHTPNALLLDIDLPYMDGLELARKIREESKHVSIMMLTAYTDTQMLLDAAELKLLKYFVKPLDLPLFKETLDRLAKELMENAPEQICLGEGYRWDTNAQKLYYKASAISLTTREKQLLSLLIKRRNKSLAFEDIMAHLWADEMDREVSVNCVKNIVSDLRKKLPKDSIKSVYGRGYMLQ